VGPFSESRSEIRFPRHRRLYAATVAVDGGCAAFFTLGLKWFYPDVPGIVQGMDFSDGPEDSPPEGHRAASWHAT
jgi:hypothetical protein